MSSNGAKAAFQIGELAKRTQLSVDAIHFYERRKLLPTPIRTTGRVRLYTENDVERLRFVRQMQMLGFSLKEITRLAQLRADKDHACESVRKFLEAKLAEVAVKIGELQPVQTELRTDLIGRLSKRLESQHPDALSYWTEEDESERKSTHACEAKVELADLDGVPARACGHSRLFPVPC